MRKTAMCFSRVAPKLTKRKIDIGKCLTRGKKKKKTKKKKKGTPANKQVEWGYKGGCNGSKCLGLVGWRRRDLDLSETPCLWVKRRDSGEAERITYRK